ncbi:MAG: transcriptional regulator, partial [Prevotella sp.]|nr:transcriptional regulator [Prevotella sp.]
ITILKEAGYLEVSKSGIGRFSRTVLCITDKGREALHTYEEGLRKLFEQRIPEKSEGAKKAI